MKKVFLNFCLNLIKNSYPNIDNEKLDEYRYGLESLYLTITKMVIIFGIALILNIFKEMIILLISFNILRATSYGMHATKSSICLFFSALSFILIPIFVKYVLIPTNVIFVIGIICTYLIYIYSPSDTKKRPIVNLNRRKKLKYLSTINSIILIILCLLIKDLVISNLIIYGIVIETFMILPISYKLFGFSYNNYLNMV